MLLALMGYDSGILVDGHMPRWDYKSEFNAVKREHKPVDHTISEKKSVVWYLRQVTRKLGNDRFAGYVGRFRYGNSDIVGNLCKKNGLKHPSSFDHHIRADRNHIAAIPIRRLAG